MNRAARAAERATGQVVDPAQDARGILCGELGELGRRRELAEEKEIGRLLEGGLLGQHLDRHDLERPLVGVQPGKRGQEGGMDIHQPTRVTLNKHGRQNPHEPCQHHQIGRVRVNALDQGLVESLTRFKFRVVQHLG